MRFKKLSLVVSSAIMLSACNGSNSSNALPTQLTGTASNGGGIQGEIHLANNHIETLTEGNGGYAIQLSDLSGPTLIKIEGTHAGSDSEQYALYIDEMRETGISNISPLTNLVVAGVTGRSPSAAFENISDVSSALTLENIQRVEADISYMIQPLLDVANVSNISFTRSNYSADFTGIDAVMSVLDFDFQADKVVITYKPEPENTIILPYHVNWNGLELFKNGLTNVELARQSLGVIYEANEVLEEMTLAVGQNRRGEYESYLHQDAHWFGSDKDQLFDAQRAIIGNETDEMDRYRDFQVVEQKSDGTVSISYTERYQDSLYASAGRRNAWFQYDDVTGELKFLGDYEPLPTSANAFLKAYLETDTNPADLNKAVINWHLEVDAFLSQADCESVEYAKSEWVYKDESLAFVNSLPNISDELALGFNSLTVSGPGLPNGQVILDKVFRSPSINNCYLASSSTYWNPMTDGFQIESDKIADITDGTQYTLTFNLNNSKTVTKTITVNKGADDRETMIEQFFAHPELINAEAGQFHYKWSRKNPFTTESDLWVMQYGHWDTGTTRVSIPDMSNEVKQNDLKDIFFIIHTAIDPYGRVITNDYSGLLD